jgi:hypothetical protein
MGSGPTAPLRPPNLNDFDALSRNPLVVLATSLGRDTCGSDEVEELAEEDNTATVQ